MASAASPGIFHPPAVSQATDLRLSATGFVDFARCALGGRTSGGGDFGSERRSGTHKKHYDYSKIAIGLTLFHSIPVGDGLLRNQQLRTAFPRPYCLVLLALPMLSELLLDCKLIPKAAEPIL